MGEGKVRNPIQKRSIEKKDKIVTAGFELICDKGYYNTNTAEIAKAAGVSTGIVYQYFSDKHDILIEGIKKYGNSIFFPMLNIDDEMAEKNDIDVLLKKVISEFVENHRLSKTAHEEITAMEHSDEMVAKLFYDAEMKLTDDMTALFIKKGATTDNLKEKVHVIVHLIDDLCHEIVYHKHDSLSYDTMTDIVVNIATSLVD